jgi:signal transduction histidine kinase
MNEVDSSNLESENSSYGWKPSTPKELLNTMLSEFRTPMMVIKGYVVFLSNEQHKELHPEAIRAISSSIERMEKLWEDMAAYTRELMDNAEI